MVYNTNYATLHDFLMDSLRTVGEVNQFPFYNIIDPSNQTNSRIIELALAGYSKNDIKVEVDNNVLTISHKQIDTKVSEPKKYIHQGITKKQFVRKFSLGQYWEVNGAEMKDGILSISLVKNIPEEKLPKVFDIK